MSRETYHFTAWRGEYPASETIALGYGGRLSAGPAAMCRTPSREGVARALGLDPGDPTWEGLADPYGDRARWALRHVGAALALAWPGGRSRHRGTS